MIHTSASARSLCAAFVLVLLASEARAQQPEQTETAFNPADPTAAASHIEVTPEYNTAEGFDAPLLRLVYDVDWGEGKYSITTEVPVGEVDYSDGMSASGLGDIRVRYSRHLMFNLTRPEKSLMLLAPLAREAGGYGRCSEEPVFDDADDPDYQAILALCRAGKQHLERIKRFDMPGFRPTSSWVREMKRFGILPGDLAEDAEVDVYATEEAYWRSLWWRPM